MIQDKSHNPDQMNFLHADLLDQLNPKHLLLRLADNIPWDYFETEFSPLYSDQGRPAKPIRLMVGLSILKHLENLSDEVKIFYSRNGNSHLKDAFQENTWEGQMY